MRLSRCRCRRLRTLRLGGSADKDGSSSESSSDDIEEQSLPFDLCQQLTVFDSLTKIDIEICSLPDEGGQPPAWARC